MLPAGRIHIRLDVAALIPGFLRGGRRSRVGASRVMAPNENCDVS